MINYFVALCLVSVAPLFAAVVDTSAKTITLTKFHSGWPINYADDVRDAMQQVPDATYVMFYAGFSYDVIIYRNADGVIDMESLDGCFGVGPEQQQRVDYILATCQPYTVIFPSAQSTVVETCSFHTLEEWLEMPIDNAVMNVTVSGQDWKVPSILAFGTYDRVYGLKAEDEWKLQRHGRAEKANYLSNYHMTPITVDGNHYPSVEHYYQASKFVMGSLVYEQVVAAATADDARKIAREYAAFADVGDDEAMSRRMKKALWSKFINPDGSPSEYGKQLMQTKQQMLIEGNKREGESDKRWGAEFDFDDMPNSVSLEGKNLLGKLLMQLRGYLQS